MSTALKTSDKSVFKPLSYGTVYKTANIKINHCRLSLTQSATCRSQVTELKEAVKEEPKNKAVVRPIYLTKGDLLPWVI